MAKTESGAMPRARASSRTAGSMAAAPAIEGWSYLAAQAWAVWVAMATDPGAHAPMWQEWAQLATQRLLDARANGDFERVLAELG